MNKRIYLFITLISLFFTGCITVPNDYYKRNLDLSIINARLTMPIVTPENEKNEEIYYQIQQVTILNAKLNKEKERLELLRNQELTMIQWQYSQVWDAMGNAMYGTPGLYSGREYMIEQRNANYDTKLDASHNRYNDANLDLSRLDIDKNNLQIKAV